MKKLILILCMVPLFITAQSGFEDDMWNWKYGELEIELLDTISSGSLSGEFYFKLK